MPVVSRGLLATALAAAVWGGAPSTAGAATVFAVDLLNSRFVSFDTATPAIQTVLATSYSAQYYGLDFDTSGRLFAVRDASVDEIRISDGAVVSTRPLSGLIDTNVTGISFAPDNTAYVSDGSHLYTLDMGSGVLSVVGSFASGLVIDIAFSPSGQLVAHDIDTNAFYEVNPLTAAQTLIGAHGLDTNYAQGMDFDPATGTLYAAMITSVAGSLWGTVNPASGSFTEIPGIVYGEYEVAIQAVPEPSTMLGSLALLVSGLFFRRR